MTFEKEEVPRYHRETLIKPLYKKDNKSEYGNYRGLSMISVDSKLIDMMILFRQRHAVYSLEKGRGCTNHIFLLG